MDPNTSDMSLAEMDYKGAFSKGKLLYVNNKIIIVRRR